MRTALLSYWQHTNASTHELAEARTNQRSTYRACVQAKADYVPLFGNRWGLFDRLNLSGLRDLEVPVDVKWSGGLVDRGDRSALHLWFL